MSKALLRALSCALFAAGCSHSSIQTQPLSPSKLNTNAAIYNGQTVVIRGLIKLAPEGHILVESQEKYSEFVRGLESNSRDFDPRKFQIYCLTIADPEFLFRNEEAVNGKTLIMRGKFIKDYLDGNSVDLGACPLPTAILIDEKDFRQRYGKILPVK